MKQSRRDPLVATVAAFALQSTAADYPGPIPLNDGAQAATSGLTGSAGVPIANMPPATEFDH